LRFFPASNGTRRFFFCGGGGLIFGGCGNRIGGVPRVFPGHNIYFSCIRSWVAPKFEHATRQRAEVKDATSTVEVKTNP
jgi:hypothetical protein